MPAKQTSRIEDLSRTALAERLDSIPALGELSTATRRALAGTVRPRTFRRRETIQVEGEASTAITLVLSGRVKMSRSLPTGRDVVLALFGPGELFGTVGALSGEPCHASVTALERTLCLELAGQDLLALLRRQPEMVDELVPFLTRRLVECRSCLVELTCYRVEARFAHLLLKLASSVGRPRGGGTFIPVPLSRRELADMTGTTVETSIRVMSRWGKEGVVRTEDRGFLVLDRAALERAAAASCGQ